MNLTQMCRWMEEEKFYFWIVIVVVLFNTTFAILGSISAPRPKKEALLAEKEDFVMDREKMAATFRQKPWLRIVLGAGTLVVFILFFLGLVFAGQFLVQRAKGELVVPWRPPDEAALWTLRDVFHIVVLLVFSSYLVELFGFLFFHTLRLEASESLRILSTTFLTDLIVLYLILRLVKREKKQTLSHLGLSKNAFTRNLLFGLRGYLSLLPALLVTLFVSLWLANLFHLSPPDQPLYDLFAQGSSGGLFLLGLVLVVFLGPVIEEVFFRGFLYNALKMKWGKKWAILSSGILFATLHANLVGFLPIALLGCALAYGYELTGSLVTSITIHIVHNFLVMVIFLFTNHFSQLFGIF